MIYFQKLDHTPGVLHFFSYNGHFLSYFRKEQEEQSHAKVYYSFGKIPFDEQKLIALLKANVKKILGQNSDEYLLGLNGVKFQTSHFISYEAIKFLERLQGTSVNSYVPDLHLNKVDSWNDFRSIILNKKSLSGFIARNLASSSCYKIEQEGSLRKSFFVLDEFHILTNQSRNAFLGSSKESRKVGSPTLENSQSLRIKQKEPVIFIVLDSKSTIGECCAGLRQNLELFETKYKRKYTFVHFSAEGELYTIISQILLNYPDISNACFLGANFGLQLDLVRLLMDRGTSASLIPSLSFSSDRQTFIEQKLEMLSNSSFSKKNVNFYLNERKLSMFNIKHP